MRGKSVFIPSDLNPFSENSVKMTSYGKKGGRKAGLRFHDGRKFEAGQQVMVDHKNGPYLAEFFKRTETGRLTVRPVCEEREDYGYNFRAVDPKSIVRKF